MNERLIQLKEACRDEMEQVRLVSLQKSRRELSAKYRENRVQANKSSKPFMQTEEDRLSYLMTRMPATTAVIHRVLKELCMRQPDMAMDSLLDMGAGPGSSLWAFAAFFPQIRATLIEQDAELIKWGKKLASKGPDPCFSHAIWSHENILKMKQVDPHDAVLFSYVLNEVPAEHHLPLVQLGWEAACKNLILIEPGTPKGYQVLLSARKHLIAQGAFLVAPCPHAESCPLANEAGRWCHFSERLERSREHRLLKEADLGYEDEKFSYLIASKQNGQAYTGRILSHPQKRSGHVHVELCTAKGLVKQTFSKKSGETYKLAKKLDWGDASSMEL